MLIIMWIKCVCRGGYLYLFEMMKEKSEEVSFSPHSPFHNTLMTE